MIVQVELRGENEGIERRQIDNDVGRSPIRSWHREYPGLETGLVGNGKRHNWPPSLGPAEAGLVETGSNSGAITEEDGRAMSSESPSGQWSG